MPRLPYSHIFSVGPSLLLSQQVRWVPCVGVCACTFQHVYVFPPAWVWCVLGRGSWGIRGACSLRRRIWILLISCWSFLSLGHQLRPEWSRPESKTDGGMSTRGLLCALSGSVRGFFFKALCVIQQFHNSSSLPRTGESCWTVSTYPNIFLFVLARKC